MEIGSRSFQNVSASREADKVFNPEIKEFFTPPSTGTVTGDVVSSAPPAVGLPDLSGINATVSSTAGTDTATVPASSFSFPPLRNDLNSAPPDTEYPSFTSFGDTIPSQADVEPVLEEETQPVTVQEAFDDMVVLKDGMVTSASLSYERFQATDGHLQESQESADPQEALASDVEKTIPEAVVTQASTEESMDVLPEVSAGPGTDAPPSQVPVEGLGLESEADVTKESISEVPEMEPEVEELSITVETLEVQTLVDEQPSSEDVVTEQDSIPGIETDEPETSPKEPPAVGELPSEKPSEEDLPFEKLPEGEPPSEKPPEGDPPLEMPPEVQISSEVQPKGDTPIELSEDEETQQEPAPHVYEVSEEDIQAIKGQRVLKTFGKKDYVGDVVNYDPETKWFKVVYEDGDEEDLEIVEVKPLLVAPGTSPTSTKKKRPRTDGDADEELNKSSKKPKKLGDESSKSAGRQKSKDGGKQLSKKQKGKSPGAKKVSKSPSKPKAKSPGSISKSAKKSGGGRKQKKPVKESKSPAKQEEKVKSKTKSEEVLDSPPAKSLGRSSMKKGAAKPRTRTPSSSKGGRPSKLTKNAEVSGGSDLITPIPKQTGTVKRGTKSSGRGKGKTGLKLKSPGTGTKVEDTPKSSKVGTKRKIDVDEPAQSLSKRLRKGGAEKDTVPGREIDRVGEATFIGKPVRKDFDGTLFDGVVVGYDKKRKYFKVKYDDGDQEDLEWRELELILVSEGKSDVDTEAKPAKVGLLSTLMSQEKKTGRSSAKKRKST